MRVGSRLFTLFITGLLAGLGGCDSADNDSMVAGGQLRLGALLGGADLTGYAVADRVVPLTFPADHGAHPEFRSEWWYLTLVLEDADGSSYGVQFTLFRQALAPGAGATENRWQTNQVYLAHFALTDVASGEHRVQERFARGHPRLAGVIAEPFQLWLEDWRIDAMGEAWRLTAGTADYAVDVTLTFNRPPVLQGEQGLSRKGEGQASYYFSVPDIEVSGTLRQAGRVTEVAGRAWLDREWSTSVLAESQQGWDWFALQLADGRRIMVFQLRRRDGTRDPYDQGLLVAADGSTTALTAQDFSLRPLRYWMDADGISWPVGWEVAIFDEVWQVAAALDDQKMETTVSYWEGLVAVYDAAGVLSGRGYLELTGYETAEVSRLRRRNCDEPADGWPTELEVCL